MTFGIRQADKYALALLDALFNEDELACSCYAMTKRSKKPPLQNDKVALLEGTVHPHLSEPLRPRKKNFCSDK